MKFATAPSRRRLISLTPLIDVVFILLIFFMLASSFLDWRAIGLDAPADATAGAAGELDRLQSDLGDLRGFLPAHPGAHDAPLRSRGRADHTMLS